MSDKNSLDSLDLKRFAHTHLTNSTRADSEPTYDNLAMMHRTSRPHSALPPSGRPSNSLLNCSRAQMEGSVSEYQEIGAIRSALPPEMERVRSALRLKGALYRDVEFPADDRALYYSRAPSHPIVWKRPHEVLRDKKRTERPRLFGPGPFDLVQGELGDCWVLAALASISEVPELMEAIIPNGQSFDPDWYAGMFAFRFWRFGKWVTVVVDDFLPTSQNELLFLHSRRENEFWGALVEKAYAKLVGSYEALKGGVLRDALTDFTGGVTECYSLDKPEAVSDKIINIIFKAFERQSLVGAEIRDRLPNPACMDNSSGGRVLESGLVAGHSYSITDVRRVRLSGLLGGPSCEVTLVRVRNPWGQPVAWNGAWSPHSKEWLGVRDSEREAAGVVVRDEGEFWLSWLDFLTHFDVLDLCHLRPGTLSEPPIDPSVPQWRCFEFSDRWRRSVSAGGRPFCRASHWTNPQFLVRLLEADEDEEQLATLIICLMQKDTRRLRHLGAQLLAVGFAIYKYVPGFDLPLPRPFFEDNNYVASCDFFINSRDVVKRFHLEPGDYVIIPSTYELGQEGDFLLRIFVECQRSTAQLVEERLSLPCPSSIRPACDPELAKKKENFRSLFYSIAGEAMCLDAFQLHRLFRLAGEKEPYVTTISVAACKALVTLVDDPGQEGGASLRIGFPDMLRVWNFLYTWGLTFHKFDKDQSGSMEVTQLRAAIADNAGYRTSPEVIYRLIHRYGDMNRRISFSDFVCCMCNLIKILNAFQTFKTDANVSLTLEQLLEIALSA